MLPLHSSLPPEEQRRVFDRPPPGVRKVVLTTNIAETAITVDDVAYVIDTGRMKEKRFDPARRMESLEDVLVSRANAKQRRGEWDHTSTSSRCSPSEWYPAHTLYPAYPAYPADPAYYIYPAQVVRVAAVPVWPFISSPPTRTTPSPRTNRRTMLTMAILRVLWLCLPWLCLLWLYACRGRTYCGSTYYGSTYYGSTYYGSPGRASQRAP